MKLVFMGTPAFAVPALSALHEHFQLMAIVTQPDKINARHKKIQPSPVKEFALEHKIDLLQPASINSDESIEALQAYPCDFFVVAAYGQILKQDVLNLPKLACINIHASLLPLYRGASPIQTAILNGDRKTGITTMMMEKGLDSGNILLRESIPIELNDSYESLEKKLANLGAKLIVTTLKTFKHISPRKQNHKEAVYCSVISKENAHIDFTKPALAIHNKIRGLNPKPGAFAFLKGYYLKIWESEIIDRTYPTHQAGEICEIIKGKGFVVKCEDLGICITKVQAEGRKKMTASEFVRGFDLEMHDIFK